MRLPGDSKKSISEIIRVNHAGELGAVMIYKGQLKALSGTSYEKDISHILSQEKKHFDYFNSEIINRKIRPTFLYPLWQCIGYAIGYIGAKLDYKAAMMCTEKIEEVIDCHYAEQLLLLEEEEDLLKNIQKIRDEENEHKDFAIENHSRETKGYFVFGSLVAMFCKAAIKIAKKI